MQTHGFLSEILARSGAAARASECHGFLCGQTCATDHPDEELWQEFLDLQTRDDDLLEQCYAEIRTLAADIGARLHSRDCDLQLLLPGDDDPLEERVNALGEWCSGFLSGFGLDGGSGIEMTAECRELLETLAAICRVDADGSGEEEEKALMEVAEYVRVGAMIIFEEIRQGGVEEDIPETMH